MPINCKICNKEFDKQITNSHLKTHNITTAQYKSLYGIDSLSSDEYKKELAKARTGKNNPNFGNKMNEEAKKLISEKKQGVVPWNKGLVVQDTTNHKLAIKKRETKYKTGELIRKKSIISNETKIKISEGVKNYAKNNKEELKSRAQTAIQTKKNRGIDLGFFRGKSHNLETKEKMSIARKKANIVKSVKADEYRKKFFDIAELTCISVSNHHLHLQCNRCKTTFSYTKQYFTDSKFTKEICKVCFPPLVNRSNKEIMLFEFVQSLCPDAISNYKFSSSKQELDIFVPSLNLGIEFNGLYWHSDTVLSDKHGDIHKHKKITELGIRCIIIMEDEWDFKKDIVISRLTNLLTKKSNKIYARNCECKEIPSGVAADFCSEYHIQGSGRSNVRFGLYFNDELISVMTFSKSNLSRKIKDWELNRFCSKTHTTIVGGASKMLSAFEKKYNPNTLITYADKRWSVGNLYEKLGFDFVADTSPGYWYFLPNEGKRIHRYTLRKNKNDNQELTEYQNRLLQGYLRIWDCGNKKYTKTYQ